MSTAIAKLLRPEGVLLNCDFKTAKEVIEAINKKYGEKTAVNGLSLSNFDIVKQ